MINNALADIVQRAIDMHVHVGPEVIPRKFTARSLAVAEKGRLAGCVLKNHFYPTAAMFAKDEVLDVRFWGSIVLNQFVGGLNPEAVYAASLVSARPLVVWLPTINAQAFLRNNTYEVAPEWVKDTSLRLRSAADIKPVIVTTKSGRLNSTAKRVIHMIAAVGGVLATGHIAPAESLVVAEYARSLGVAVIITHPIYQHIAMTVQTQQQLAALGCFLEQTYSMHSIDGIPIQEIAAQIKAVGAESVLLSSDMGQAFSPPPSEALAEFAGLLLAQGITLGDIEKMLVANPRRVLGIAT